MSLILYTLGIILISIVVYYLFLHNSFDPKMLVGKRVLVTGASSGIGAEIAYFYAGHGALLVIAARQQKLLEEVAAECRRLGARKAEVVTVDLAVPDDRDKLVAETKRILGGLDHLVLNHGIMSNKLWAADDVATQEHQMAVNFTSYVQIMAGLLDSLIASKGNLCVVSSGVGKVPTAYTITYSATKHALQGFFGGLRQEMLLLKTGVSVTVAFLGYINTEKAVSIMSKVANALPAPSPVDECAAAIVRGVAVRAREVYYPFSTWFVSLAYFVMPKVVDHIAAGIFAKTK